MLLRASGEREGKTYHLAAVTDAEADAGVPNSGLIRGLTEAAVRNDWDALAELRDEAAAAMGEQQMVDVLTVAAAFNGITRVADATGIPLDANTQQTTGELRAQVGIDAFDYAAKTERYDAVVTEAAQVGG